jgi:Bacterial membrane protein YfhO
MLGDLWTVDRRYVNDKNFVREQLHENFKESVADKAILEDKDPSYRVFNLNNPWQETYSSYYHKSIGGYHAAKLLRYQELIDNRLNPEYMEIIKAFQGAKSLDEIYPALQAATSLNMLNMRYIIYSPEQPPLRNPFAYGNAWFVKDVRLVEDADAEMAAMALLKPLETAVVDKRFAKDLEGFVPQTDSTATIVLETYQPNALTYKSKADSEQLAVFSEIYYQPGWKAFIDGKEVPHFRADWTLRAMRIPAGEHQIEFKFIPDGFNAASSIAYYGGLLILLMFIGAAGYSAWQLLFKKQKA